MFGFRCRACEAKDSEIARLALQYNSLMDRFVTVCGKPEAVSPIADLPESSAQEVPFDIERETEKALLGIAEARGMSIEEFADA